MTRSLPALLSIAFLVSAAAQAAPSGYEALKDVRARFEAAGPIPSLGELRPDREWACQLISPNASSTPGVEVSARKPGYVFTELKLPAGMEIDSDEYTVVARSGDGIENEIFRLSLNSDTLAATMQDDEGSFCPMFIRVAGKNLIVEYGCEGYDPADKNTQRPEMIAKPGYSAITYVDCTPN
jgi:hypothetical protein